MNKYSSFDIAQISPELKTVLFCAQLELSSVDIEAIRQLLAKGIDWALLLEVSKHHRLMPLVYTHLSQVAADLFPSESLEHFKQVYQQVSHACLMQAAELQRVTAIFKLHDIDLAILKGWALIKPLYHNIALRQAHDIDILVRRADLAVAESLLDELNYHVEYQQDGFKINSKIGQLVVNHRSELSYVSTARKTYIDLHWHLTHSYAEFPLDTEALWSNMVTSDNNKDTPSAYYLTSTTNFVFLCYHGAKHRWFRFHWLCDVALLIKRDELDWQAIVQEARCLGILPTVGLAVVLCNRLFRVPIPNTLASDLALLNSGKNLANKILADITRCTFNKDNNIIDYGDALWNIYWSFCCQTLWRYRLITWTCLFVPSITDFNIVKLPDRLSWLYFVLRPIRWFLVGCSIVGSRLTTKLNN